MLWKIIGLSAATLTMFSFFPQIVKVIKNRSAKDVSIVTLIQLACGVSLWVLYGAYLKDGIIILANAVTLSSLFILLFLYRLYGRAR